MFKKKYFLCFDFPKKVLNTTVLQNHLKKCTYHVGKHICLSRVITVNKAERGNFNLVGKNASFFTKHNMIKQSLNCSKSTHLPVVSFSAIETYTDKKISVNHA